MAIASESAMNGAAMRSSKGLDRRFYLGAAIAAFAIVFAGFARTYYLRALFGTPSLPWLLHLHGALMTSWFVLFFVQTRLIAAHRITWHKRLGIFGGILAMLMVIVGATVAVRGAARDVRASRTGGTPTPGPPTLQFMGFILYVLLVFALLVGAALLLRRRREWHKRLMLLSCLSMVGPGLSRIPLKHTAVAFLRTGGPGGLFGLDLLLVYVCIAWDTWRHRRAHPAFVGGALLIATEDLPFIWMFLSTPTWARFATWLVR